MTTTLVRAADYRVVRLVHDGEVYTPIVLARTGRMLEPSDVAELAHVRDVGVVGERVARVVLMDESAPQPWSDTPAMRIVGMKCIRKIPLELGDSGFVIGAVEGAEALPAGATPQTEGPHLVARARFHDTVLGSIAWSTLQAGLFRGVCCEIEHWRTEPSDGGRIVDGIVTAVRLGTVEGSCFANARILATSATP